MKDNFTVLSIIPARGGSKGIPKKNIRLINGTPLICYSIIEASKSTYIDNICVSTEDDEIRQTVSDFHVDIVDRPRELAHDDTLTEPVMLHALDQMENKYKMTFDLIVLLQPTSPLRKSYDIDLCIDRIVESGSGSVLTVTRVPGFLWRYEDNQVKAYYDYQRRPMRQDMSLHDCWFKENGAVYVTQREILVSEKNRLGGRIDMVEMNPLESIDIDTYEDLFLVEAIIQVRQRKVKE